MAKPALKLSVEELPVVSDGVDITSLTLTLLTFNDVSLLFLFCYWVFAGCLVLKYSFLGLLYGVYSMVSF